MPAWLDAVAGKIGALASTVGNATTEAVESVASAVAHDPLADLEVGLGTVLVVTGAGAVVGASLITKGVTALATDAMKRSDAQSGQVTSPGTATVAARRQASGNPEPLHLGTPDNMTNPSATKHAAAMAAQQRAARTEIGTPYDELRELAKQLLGRA